MAVFKQRHERYKGGLALFLIGMAAFITGFATPNWSDFRFRLGISGSFSSDYVLHGHLGLWSSCYKGIFGESHCTEIATSSGWMEAVKGLQATALAVMVLAGFYAVYANFLTSKLLYNKFLSGATVLAGSLGLAGAITYAVKSHQDVDFLNNLEGNHDLVFSLSWSFGLSVAGCVFLMVAGTLLDMFSRPSHMNQPPATTFTNITNMNVTGMPVTAEDTEHVYSTPMYTSPPPT